MTRWPSRAWAGWRALWAGEEHPCVMAALRILVAGVLLYDLAQVWRFHLIVPLWGPADAGGMGQPDRQAEVVELYRWFRADVHTPRLAFGALVLAVFCFGIGLFTQVAALVAVLVYAQFARILPEADRGIDLLLRNVLLIFAFVPAGRFWGVDARIFGGLGRIPAWSRRLLILQLVVMYWTAGIQKTAVAWWPWGGFSALYIVLQDMAVARIPFAWLRSLYPATQVLTALTMLFEWLAVFIPLAYWFRASRTRPGWLRAQFNRANVVPWWLAMGVALHLGIALTLHLGIFPWAMLGLYPAFFHPDEIRRWMQRR